METITLKNSWSIIRVEGFACFLKFAIHRLTRGEAWIVHEFHIRKVSDELESDR